MKTIKKVKIYNINRFIYDDKEDETVLYLYVRHGREFVWIKFLKKKLLDYLKDREKTFNNLFHFLEYEVLGKLGIKIEGSLTDTYNFIRKFKENYDKDKLGLPKLI